MKIFLTMMMMMISIMMFFFSHPLSMGLMILIQTIFTCLLSGMLINTYWFSYILFLTFLGGLLVLFIYVSSVASNEMFKMNFFFLKIIFISLIIIIILNLYMFNNLNLLNYFFNNEMENFYNYNNMFFNNENKINLSKLYNNQTFMMMMMMIIYLFITLVAIVKITNIFYGPLRPTM
uniref:NADH-ubiquinone oxidoreductase chain 6 n=1 Tax=Choristoneura longicellana TaxID=928821 RepID=K9JH03_CHOLO|nr:NADH dehydrogenase subunit 6 [Choristoneura longicellana]ADQ64005.1 NADH dehydrogenase subunit 6 [Choristoneura longicellana]